MAIDRGDSHFDDAGTWERACRHIGLFLWWAAGRGLASEEHDPSALAEDPTQYVISECDTKLWNEDLSDEGNAFAEAAYDAYLGEVSAYAKSLRVGDYDIPANAATKAHFSLWLDRRLDAWRAAKS
ncbi:MAG: hypothetical protein KF901_34395 [Myxococcales bacterium]|nr:hypothetical protein [Myxococcales bacterium]